MRCVDACHSGGLAWVCRRGHTRHAQPRSSRASGDPCPEWNCFWFPATRSTLSCPCDLQKPRFRCPPQGFRSHARVATHGAAQTRARHAGQLGACSRDGHRTGSGRGCSSSGAFSAPAPRSSSPPQPGTSQPSSSSGAPSRGPPPAMYNCSCRCCHIARSTPPTAAATWRVPIRVCLGPTLWSFSLCRCMHAHPERLMAQPPWHLREHHIVRHPATGACQAHPLSPPCLRHTDIPVLSIWSAHTSHFKRHRHPRTLGKTAATHLVHSRMHACMHACATTPRRPLRAGR